VHSLFLVEKKIPGSDGVILFGIPPLAYWEESDGKPTRLLWINCGPRPGLPPDQKMPPHVDYLDVRGTERLAARRLLEGFIEGSFKQLPSLLVSRGVEAHAEYESPLADVFELLESAFRNRTTRRKDAFRWQLNCVRNILDYPGSRLPREAQNVLSGAPAWIVGAAPSLDHSMGALRQVRECGVLFAADSAWRVLRSHGIEPDFVVSMDASKTAERCLPQDGLRGERIVLSLTSPADWRQRIPAENRFYLAGNQLTHLWLEKKGVPPAPLSALVNCGVTAASLARFLGCAPLYLFGMDFALDPTRPSPRHHEAWKNGWNPLPMQADTGGRAAVFPKVPGNHSDEVPTHAYGDWKEFNALLSSWPEGLVHVVTDRGARLSNTRVLTPASFLEGQGASIRRIAPWSFPKTSAVSASQIESLRESLLRFSEQLEHFLPSLKSLLALRGGGDAAQALCQLMKDREKGLMLGAFTLKWLPDLLPPAMTEPERWSELLAELELLAAQMKDPLSVTGPM
jgi:hypothetical protein